MKKETQVPTDILKATHSTLKWAMVFCRNYTASPDANPRVIYEIMDAIHEIPSILNQWGTKVNNIDTLRLYFGCFDYKKWCNSENMKMVPDLVAIFNEKLNEYKE